MSTSFWRKIVVRSFRVPIRIAFALERPSLKELQHLMKAAIVEELRSQGYTIREISVLLGVSEYWASQLVQKSKNIHTDNRNDSILLRVILRLRKGPATAYELMDLIPHGSSFRVDRIALALLTKACLLVTSPAWSEQASIQ